MTSCSTSECGVGGWGGPLPGDPDNNSVLSATPAFGGIDVSWTLPATNPEAVAYVQLYRGVLPDFNSAIIIATVGGNFFYDKTTSPQLIQYYYWIRIVSVNGTVGAVIGPASAAASPAIDQVILGLTGRIDAGLLAQSLKGELDKITLNYGELLQEVNNRIGGDTALSGALSTLQVSLNNALGLIGDEIADRQEGDSLLLGEVNGNAVAIAQEAETRAAAIQNEAESRAAAILTERNARITAIESEAATRVAAILAESTARQTAIGTLNAAVQSEQQARITAVSAEASARDVLATQLRGNYSGSDVAQVTSGLIYSERTSRITADQNLQTQINTLVAASSGDFGDLIAAVQEEQTARLAGDAANALSISTIGARLDGIKDKNGLPTNKSLEATLVDDRQARVDGDTALSTQITTLNSSVVNNYNTLNSAIQAESTARSTAVSSEATQRETLAAQLRGTYTGTNPALLSTGLLYTERQARISAEQAISSSVTALSATVNQNTAAITSEASTRATADTALSNSFNTLSAQVNDSTTGLPATRAKLLNDYYTKASTDSAISAAVLNLVSNTGLATTLGAYVTSANLNQNYYTKTATDSAISAATTTLASTINGTLSNYVTVATLTNDYFTKSGTNSAISTAVQNLVSVTGLNTTLQGYANVAALQSEQTARTNADNALASQISTAQTTAANNLAAAQTTLQTNINSVDGKVNAIGALYTAKLTVNGLVGGFGVYNNGTEVQAGFDVDTFWVGRTNANKKKPFIIENDQVYIDQAAINKLTFTKLRDESGAVMVENGKLKAGYISGKDLEIVGGDFSSPTSSRTYASEVTFNFNSSTEGFTFINTSGFISDNALYMEASAFDPIIISPPMNISGALNYIVRVRIKRLAGTGWDGGLFYETPSHVITEAAKGRVNDTTVLGEWVVLEYDMSKPFTGGQDWVNSRITKVRFDFGTSPGDAFAVDWIMLGRYELVPGYAGGRGFYLGPKGLQLGNYEGGIGTFLKYDQDTGSIRMNGLSIVNGTLQFSGEVVSTNNIYNESVNIFKLARGAALPDYVRTYKGGVTPAVTVNGWMPLQLDPSALNNKLGAVDYDSFRTLLPAGTYFYELSVPVKCQGSDTNDAAYTAIIVNPPGTPTGSYQTQCYGYPDGKGGYVEYCNPVYVPTAYQVLSTAGVNVVGDWQTATIFGVGRLTLTSPTYISAAVLTTDGYPTLNVVARNGYSTTILRIWRDAT